MSWIYGLNAVAGALEDAEARVEEVWLVRISKPSSARAALLDRVRERGIRYRIVEDGALGRVVGPVAHQGVAARTREFAYAEAESLLSEAGAGLIVVLDGVQDPRNLGAIIRTVAAFGGRGVVVPRNRAAAVTAVTEKASAGAASRLPVARVTNLARFLERAREEGFWIWAAVARGGEEVDAATLPDRMVAILGSEGEGVRRNQVAHADGRMTIRLAGEESLNVSVATGIVAWEWRRRLVRDGKSA